MATIASLEVLLGMNVAAFTKGRTEAEKELARLNASIGKAGALAKAGLGALGIGLSAGMLIEHIHAAAEAIDVNAKLADRLDITTESLLGMQHAANLAGVDNASFNADLEKMVKNLGEAAQDGGPVADMLDMMGLNAKQLADQKLDETMGQIADGIAAIENPAQRAAAATTIFGKSGQALLNTLMEGSEGLRRNTEDVKRLGASYSRLDAAQVEAANDALTRLNDSFKGIAQQTAIEIAPGLTQIINGFTRMVPAIGATTGAYSKALPILGEMVRLLDAMRMLDDGSAAREAMDKRQQAAEYTRLSERMAEAKKAADELARSGEAITREFAPTTVFTDRITLLDTLLAKSLITQEVYGRALAAAEQTFLDSNPINKATNALKEQMAMVGMTARQMELYRLQVMGADDAAMALANHLHDLIDAEQNAAAVNQTVDALRQQVAAMQLSEREQTLLALRAHGASEAAISEALALLETKDALDRMNKSMAEQSRLRDSMKAEGKQIFEATRTPAEKLALTLDHLDDLFANGAFGTGAEAADTYTRAVRSAREEFERLANATGQVQQLGNFDMLIGGKAKAGGLDQAGLGDFVLPPPVVRGLDAATNRDKPLTVNGQKELIENTRRTVTAIEKLNTGLA